MELTDRQEKIGKVILDYSKYPNEDYYSEGSSEDALLQVVAKYDESEFDRIILGSRSWPMLYHLSHIRGNVVSWLPICKSHKVLEIGSGCGAITGILSDMAKDVTCVELSKKRSTINATRNRHRGNIKILVGNFEDIEQDLSEKYDFITLIGVFEYAESYIKGESPHEILLKRVGRHLAPGGKIIIAIENQYGLKYFAGCKEDHTGRYYEGIEGYTNSTGVRTFSKKSIEEITEKSGFNSEFYYPYPDYKLAHTIYSDEILPKEGSLTTNLRNFDADRIVVFNESKVFDQIIREGMFPHYSNSFLVVLSYGEVEWKERTIYAKYSSERKDEFAIMTYVTVKEGKRHIYKTALTAKANEHIASMQSHFEMLKSEFHGLLFKPNHIISLQKGEEEPAIAGRSSKARDKIELQYLVGTDFEQYLNMLQENKQYEKMLFMIEKFVNELSKTKEEESFQTTGKFEKLFGKWTLGKDYAGCSPCDFDLIFSNILFTEGENQELEWNILDYEWTFEFQIPLKYVIYRSIYYWLRDEKSKKFRNYLNKQGIDLYEKFNIMQNERDAFCKMEEHFQQYIIGEKASLTLLHAIMPSATVDMALMFEGESLLRNLHTPKVYFSIGEGFCEENKIPVFAGVNNVAEVTIEFKLEKRMRAIRIDPTEYPCSLKVNKITIIMEEGEQIVKRYIVNGLKITPSMFLFDTDDAQIIIEEIPHKAIGMRVEYTVGMLRKAFFDEITKALAEKRRRNKKKLSLLERILIKYKIIDRRLAMDDYYYNQESDA